MKIIRCTQKLIKELRVEPEENIWAKLWLESWHANVFNIERKKCVLITNDATLYSLFLVGFKKDSFINFKLIINQYFFKSMLSDNLPQALIEKALGSDDNVCFTKSANKSVMASMSNFKQCLEYLVPHFGGLENGGASKAQDSINRIPMKAIGFQFPIDCFIEKLKND